MTTGASPISDEVMMFLRVCFGATVVEGYGMTETSCTISLTRLGAGSYWAVDGCNAGDMSGRSMKILTFNSLNLSGCLGPSQDRRLHHWSCRCSAAQLRG